MKLFESNVNKGGEGGLRLKKMGFSINAFLDVPLKYERTWDVTIDRGLVNGCVLDVVRGVLNEDK